jgi:hypothetical protein
MPALLSPRCSTCIAVAGQRHVAHFKPGPVETEYGLAPTADGTAFVPLEPGDQ